MPSGCDDARSRWETGSHGQTVKMTNDPAHDCGVVVVISAWNQPRGRLFFLRCNTSWIVLDFVHVLRAYDDRSRQENTFDKISCSWRPCDPRANAKVQDHV